MKSIPIIVILLCATLLGSAQNVIEEKTRINIMMLEQSDLTALNREANRLATKHERREFVVETLKRQAESSQADLMLLLREMERDGMVDDIRQLWIANAISCNASEKAIQVISQRSDIMSVNKSEMVYCNSLPEMSVQPRNISRGLADHVAKINADKVWELGYTGQGVLVAVVDTGIDTAHLDLAGRMWDGGDEFPNHGYDVYEHDYDPSDQRGHGTKVAGIVCGTGMAGTQTGVAPDATVMNVKVFGNDAAGSPDAILLEGVQFAVEHGADVINMSFGMPGQVEVRRGLYRQVSDNVLAAGIVGVSIAGNERYYIGMGLLNPPYLLSVPGACPSPWRHPDQAVNQGGVSSTICVGSVDNDNTVSWFSSPGPVTWADSSNYGDYPYTPGSTVEIGLIKPDIAAPGNGIVSLKFDTTDEYVADAGTSFAAPSVTGVIALMLSKNPELMPAEIDSILQTTAVKLTEHKSNDTGSGLVDALAAVQAIGNDGVDEIKADEIMVYPNPAKDAINIVGLQNINSSISLYSIDGKLVKCSEIIDNQCDISDLQSGIYLLKIKTSEGIFYKKIIKERL